MRSRLVVAVLLMSIVMTVPASVPPAQAAGPAILGAGSTWSQIAIDQWRSDVIRMGLSVNYQGVGSTTGRQFFAANTVDFAVSEIPFQPEDPAVRRGYKYLPIVAGGTSMMYNLKSASGAQIRNLQLSSSTIAAIFTGQIRNWSDRRIRADYGAALPSRPIKVILRSDGSGTSAQFSAYLKAMQPSAWRSFTSSCRIPNEFTSFWPYGESNCLPNGIGQKGSDGVANYIANLGLGLGAIGYVEAGYAIARRFPVVAVKNASGRYTHPTAQNVAIALQHATLHKDSTQELSGVYRAPERTAYPISSYSYMIVPTDSSITPAEGAVLGRFINYFACTGQQAAERLGYSPMPKRLVEFAFAAQRQIPGAPEPPKINGKDCPNPMLQGGLKPDTDPPIGTDDPRDPNDTDDPNRGEGVGPNEDNVGPGDGGEEIEGGSLVPEVIEAAEGEVLTDDQLALLKAQADEQILGTQPAAAFPLWVVAAALLLLIFGPLFLRFKGSRDDPGR